LEAKQNTNQQYRLLIQGNTLQYNQIMPEQTSQVYKTAFNPKDKKCQHQVSDLGLNYCCTDDMDGFFVVQKDNQLLAAW
jgi:hypothetical protein